MISKKKLLCLMAFLSMSAFATACEYLPQKKEVEQTTIAVIESDNVTSKNSEINSSPKKEVEQTTNAVIESDNAGSKNSEINSSKISGPPEVGQKQNALLADPTDLFEEIKLPADINETPVFLWSMLDRNHVLLLDLQSPLHLVKTIYSCEIDSSNYKKIFGVEAENEFISNYYLIDADRIFVEISSISSEGRQSLSSQKLLNLKDETVDELSDGWMDDVPDDDNNLKNLVKVLKQEFDDLPTSESDLQVFYSETADGKNYVLLGDTLYEIDEVLGSSVDLFYGKDDYFIIIIGEHSLNNPIWEEAKYYRGVLKQE